MVGVVDVGWLCAVGPGEAAGVGDDGFLVGVAETFVVGGAGEEQGVSASVVPPAAQPGLWWASQ